LHNRQADELEASKKRAEHFEKLHSELTAQYNDELKLRTSTELVLTELRESEKASQQKIAELTGKLEAIKNAFAKMQ
jgi:hypothetical protein